MQPGYFSGDRPDAGRSSLESLTKPRRSPRFRPTLLVLIGPLSDDIVDDVSLLDARETKVEPLEAIRETLVIDAEQP